MVWADGSRMPMPTDDWHVWYAGEPNNDKGREDCTVITNYRYWELRKQMMELYYWRDYGCSINPQEIQGYLCEGKWKLFAVWSLGWSDTFLTKETFV